MILGFVIGQAVTIATCIAVLQMQQRTEEMKFIESLGTKHQGEAYTKVASAIASCRPIYKRTGGVLTGSEINQYLSFFEELAMFERGRVLSREIIAEAFGAHLVFALGNKEVTRYIAALRQSMHQPHAFVGFERIATAMKSDPRFAQLAANHPCGQQLAAQQLPAAL
jgi:hypothetical protein